MEKMINEIEVNGIKYLRKDASESNVEGLKPVLIRSYASGVHFGLLEKEYDLQSGIAVDLINSRRVHYWDGACSLSQLAMEGSKCPDKCRIAVVVNKIRISQVIEIIELNNYQFELLNSYKEWKK